MPSALLNHLEASLVNTGVATLSYLLAQEEPMPEGLARAGC